MKKYLIYSFILLSLLFLTKSIFVFLILIYFLNLNPTYKERLLNVSIGLIIFIITITIPPKILVKETSSSEDIFFLKHIGEIELLGNTLGIDEMIKYKFIGSNFERNPKYPMIGDTANKKVIEILRSFNEDDVFIETIKWHLNNPSKLIQKYFFNSFIGIGLGSTTKVSLIILLILYLLLIPLIIYLVKERKKVTSQIFIVFFILYFFIHIIISSRARYFVPILAILTLLSSNIILKWMNIVKDKYIKILNKNKQGANEIQ